MKSVARLRHCAKSWSRRCDCCIQLVPVTAEARGLAQLYVQEGIIPARFLDDALHVAVAVCHRLDVVVSWNMDHLVNMRRVEQINRINLRSAMPSIRIHTPKEVMGS